MAMSPPTLTMASASVRPSLQTLRCPGRPQGLKAGSHLTLDRSSAFEKSQPPRSGCGPIFPDEDGGVVHGPDRRFPAAGRASLAAREDLAVDAGAAGAPARLLHGYRLLVLHAPG